MRLEFYLRRMCVCVHSGGTFCGLMIIGGKRRGFGFGYDIFHEIDMDGESFLDLSTCREPGCCEGCGNCEHG